MYTTVQPCSRYFFIRLKKIESCLLQCQILQSKVLCWSEVCSILILAPSKSYEDAQGHIDILSFVVEQSTMRKITNLRYGKKQKIHDYHCLFFSPKSTKMLELNLLLGISFKSTEPFLENGVYVMR